MDKQDWTPKLGTKTFYLKSLVPPKIDTFSVVSLRLEEDHCDNYQTIVTVWVSDGIKSENAENLFPTREAAKAALIEKLEQALEEAKRL